MGSGLVYVLPRIDYYHQSAGIRACHRLIHELNERGQTAYTLGRPNPEWNERYLLLADFLDLTEFIAIYPEVVHGNPLTAPHVARWVLNTPGLLGGDKEYDPSEMVWTWDTRFTDAPLLTVDIIERGLFFDAQLEKDGDCCHIGKGKGIPLKGMPLITQNWPATRTEIADLLRRTGTLYTYDDCTTLTDEAMLCGAKAVLLPSGELVAMNPSVTLDHAPRIEAFIEATQA